MTNGVPGSQQVDLNDDNARRKYMMDLVQASKQQDM
jgi:hypothetical protein